MSLRDTPCSLKIRYKVAKAHGEPAGQDAPGLRLLEEDGKGHAPAFFLEAHEGSYRLLVHDPYPPPVLSVLRVEALEIV